ncbi:Arginine N-methyltransferase 2 [Agyrium rufum]|nr:Arginine N-methyltransferase 2 [Agyrium rufum]
MEDVGTEIDIDAQLILLASSKHDIESLRTLLRTGSANVQDPETGLTPLHAAVLACEESIPSSPLLAENHSNGSESEPAATEVPSSPLVNGAHVNGSLSAATTIDGETDGIHSQTPNVSATGAGSTTDTTTTTPAVDSKKETIDAAAKTMKLLLQNGAIWNDLDRNDETPGCIARRLGLTTLYEIMVDAGCRAEMLLNRLDGYEALGDGEDETDGDEPGKDDDAVEVVVNGRAEEDAANNTAPDTHLPSSSQIPAQEQIDSPTVTADDTSLSNPTYLRQPLTYQPHRLLDASSNGVMMSWETSIMQRSADLLCRRSGLRVLNIGFGMGIIDTHFQDLYPKTHHIVEAHPDVLAKMRADGWYEKEEVVVHEGRWQDVLPKLIEASSAEIMALLEDGEEKEGATGEEQRLPQPLVFDAIYFDTFAEDYAAFREFFSEMVIGLLDDGGKWSFFHGLGADRQICYDVYTKVLEMDLLEAGFDIEWEKMKVELDGATGASSQGGVEWEGVRRKYWNVDDYRLPTCTFAG